MPQTESHNLINSSGDDKLAEFNIAFPAMSSEHPALLQLTPVEIILGESLLTPGLQTKVRVHSYTQNLPLKDMDIFKNQPMKLTIQRNILKKFGINHVMRIQQVCYRLSDRKKENQNTEEFVLHGCDQTLLNDAKSLVSKMWKCTTPSTVVNDVLRECVGAKLLDIESSDPARDYIAENIHPFQVVNQQANAALNGNDPSFIHYMTFGGGVKGDEGVHHFRSLKSLIHQQHIIEYSFEEGGNVSGYGNPRGIMTHSFPCDFDLLSDLLNGIDENGKDISSAGLFNPVTKQFNLFGNQQQGCGIGGGVYKAGMTNQDSAGQQNACPDYSYLYLPKRQARMGLLEKDNTALRLTVPWNPELHAGKVIRVMLQNKADPRLYNYGSGNYLITAMTHNIKRGGLATTTMDCASYTAGAYGVL
jgi:hypothetical protein